MDDQNLPLEAPATDVAPKDDSSEDSFSSDDSSVIEEVTPNRSSQNSETDLSKPATSPENAVQEASPTSTRGKRKTKTRYLSKKVPSFDDELAPLCEAGPSCSNYGGTSTQSQDTVDCPVCRRPIASQVVAIPDCCNHSFCHECIYAWVTKARSNCPMDRKDIKFLNIWHRGMLIRKDPIEPKWPDDDELGLEEDGDICPDCGWTGIRPPLGVCLHCMFHHDHPWPIEDCPQCMEAESNESDEDWDPSSSTAVRTVRFRRSRRISESSIEEVISTDVDAFSETSESEVDEDLSLDEEQPLRMELPPAPVRQRRAPVRRKIKRRVTRRKKRKAATKKATLATRRKTSKRKTKKRATAASTRRRKRTVVGRRKKRGTLRIRRAIARRQITPPDSAKARLAKLLGLRPPKVPGQMIPRGCRPKPVTSAQIAAAAAGVASGSGIVTTRPVGSLSYHHRALPTLHLFGGDELEYFPSDSDSDRGDGGDVSLQRSRSAHVSEATLSRRLENRKNLHYPGSNIHQPSTSSSMDVLGSILESQTQMRSPFDILNDGGVVVHSSLRKRHLSPVFPNTGRTSRLNLHSAASLGKKRPSSPTSTQTSANARNARSPSATTASNVTAEVDTDDANQACSATTSSSSAATSSGKLPVMSAADTTLVSSSFKTKTDSDDDDDDDEVDLYADIPNSTKDPTAVAKSAYSTNEERFDASPVSNDSEPDANETMVIDETESPHSTQSKTTPNQSPTRNQPPCPTPTPVISGFNYPTPIIIQPPKLFSPNYGNYSPCYGGGSPHFTAADLDISPESPTYEDCHNEKPADDCPNRFMYSSTSMDIARNFSGYGEDDDDAASCFNKDNEDESKNGDIASPFEPVSSGEFDTSDRRVQSTCVSPEKSDETKLASPIKSPSPEFEDDKRKMKNKRKSILVEEIFGSDLEDCGMENKVRHEEATTSNVPLQVFKPTAVAVLTGLEGLDTETISETEEENNFNDPEELMQKPMLRNDLDYEEGEIVEERPRPFVEPIPDYLLPDESNIIPEIRSPDVATSPVSPDQSMNDNGINFDNLPPASPSSHENMGVPRSPTSSRRRSNKPRSPDRKRSREEKIKKSSKSNKSGNIEWKKLSKNSKERNYRDGKAKENVSHERSEKKERSSREDRRSKKKKVKRKDLERYDVRKVITERSRREAEKKRRDKFGRDISREPSRSPTKSPEPRTHHQSRHRRRSPYIPETRTHRPRNGSWSSNRSKYSASVSSHGSPHRHASRHRRLQSKEGEQYMVRSLSASPSRLYIRDHARDLPVRCRRDRSDSYSHPTGFVTFMANHERIIHDSILPKEPPTTPLTLASSINPYKKKGDKSKDKKKKDGKKKKKDYRRHVLAPLAAVGMCTNSDPSSLASILPIAGFSEKKKRKREKSPPASKEVFQSGDNILVSVNFNKPNNMLPASIMSIPTTSKYNKDLSNYAHCSNVVSPPRRVVKNLQPLRAPQPPRNILKRPRREIVRSPVNLIPDRSPKRRNVAAPRMMSHDRPKEPAMPANPLDGRRRQDVLRRKRIATANRKPVAVIDLEASPYAERAPSPAEIITLSDDESRLSCCSRSSVDSRRGRRSGKDERSRKLRRKSGSKMNERQMSAPMNTTPLTVSLGPKTPPEPQIKFSINAKPQLRCITNPLQDEDDDIDVDMGNSMSLRDKCDVDSSMSGSSLMMMKLNTHNLPTFRGPNTPPEPCTTMQSRSNGCITSSKHDVDMDSGLSPADAKSPDVYDPFEPTKSPSDASSSGRHQSEFLQVDADSMSEILDSGGGNIGPLTPGSISDNSISSSRNIAEAPASPSPEADDMSSNSQDNDMMSKDELKKTENSSSQSLHQNLQDMHNIRSPLTNISVSVSDNAVNSELKPSSTTISSVTAQSLIGSIPQGNLMCAAQSIFRAPLNTSTPYVMTSQSARASHHQSNHQQPDTTTTTDVVDMDLESPYSPDSCEGDDLFEPPDKPPSPSYPSRKDKFGKLRSVVRQCTSGSLKRNVLGVDKFDQLFTQSASLKKEASSTSAVRGASRTTRTTHGHRSSSNKVHHSKAESKPLKTTPQKSRGKSNHLTTEKSRTVKKEISLKMDEDQLKILDELPSSAVEMQVKEKFLKKLNRQERVVEEVKLALKPHYTKKLINKDDYKEILRRSVPKICHNKSGEINPIRIRMLIGEYVKKFRYIKKKDTVKLRSNDKQRKV